MPDVRKLLKQYDPVQIKQEPKLQIYKGMIQYLLESTPYTIKNIADLSSSTVKTIRSIYCDNRLPAYFVSEINLAKLYYMIIELHATELYEERLCNENWR